MKKSYSDGYNLSYKDRVYAETIHNYVETPMSRIKYSSGLQADADYYSSEHLLPMEQSEEKYVEEYHDELHEAIKLLTIKQQAILLLYLRGYKGVEIAKALKITSGAVTMAMYGSYMYKNGKKYRGGGIIKSLQNKITKKVKLNE